MRAFACRALCTVCLTSAILPAIALGQSPTVRLRDASPGSTPANFQQTYTEPTGSNIPGAVMVSLSTMRNVSTTVTITTSGSAAVGRNTGCVGPVDVSFDVQQVTWAPNDTAPRLLQWNVCGDPRDDPDTEQLVITLSSVSTGVTIDPNANRATLTITDDDPTPTVTVSNLQVTEPAGNSATVAVTVSLSAPSNRQVTLTVEAEEIVAALQRLPVGDIPQATAGKSCSGSVDFLGSRHNVDFGSGFTSRTFTVTICGDARREGSTTMGSPTYGKEVFQVRGAALANATFAQSVGYVVISDR